MIELLGKNLTELQAVITEALFPRFRAKQIMDYIYKRLRIRLCGHSNN